MHNGRGGLGPARAGQANIHEDEVGAMLAISRQSRLAIGRLRYHLHVRLHV